MTEHYTRNTESATAWCNRCGRFTQHKVSDGRLAHCIDLEHPAPPAQTKAQIRRQAEAEKRSRQKELF
jgi:hypothetical protein